MLSPESEEVCLFLNSMCWEKQYVLYLREDVLNMPQSTRLLKNVSIVQSLLILVRCLVCVFIRSTRILYISCSPDPFSMLSSVYWIRIIFCRMWRWSRSMQTKFWERSRELTSALGQGSILSVSTRNLLLILPTNGFWEAFTT